MPKICFTVKVGNFSTSEVSALLKLRPNGTTQIYYYNIIINLQWDNIRKTNTAVKLKVNK